MCAILLDGRRKTAIEFSQNIGINSVLAKRLLAG
jgi:hypothetical protein